ncbi:MAG: AraC family transcriptional regulator [Proteobacteria bacterium]|nr:AraC family transcriptional regulator [Pseudomonadota bacterium]MBU1715299.1 AraC family transcriptional regulator [Pseudomonadota bacterium]
MHDNIAQIQHLVGPVTQDQIRYVDCFVTKHLGLFLPVGGACQYALSHEHTHPAYMFVLAFDDHTKIYLKGKIISTRPRHIFTLSPDIAHTELAGDLPPRYLALMIDKTFWLEQLRLYPEAQPLILNGNFVESPSDFLPTCKKFMIECQNISSGSEAILNALSLELCHYLIRAIWQIKSPKETISSRFEIDRVIEFIQTNMANKISIIDMAKVACMSPSNFSRVFKKEVGTSPYDYLLDNRLIQAKKILQAGDKEISEVALDCGFSSTSHFSAKFSRKYNLSPAKFRMSFR